MPLGCPSWRTSSDKVHIGMTSDATTCACSWKQLTQTLHHIRCKESLGCLGAFSYVWQVCMCWRTLCCRSCTKSLSPPPPFQAFPGHKSCDVCLQSVRWRTFSHRSHKGGRASPRCRCESSHEVGGCLVGLWQNCNWENCTATVSPLRDFSRVFSSHLSS